MKKLLPIFLPSLLIFTFCFIDNFTRKQIVLAIYLYFPLIYIIQGMLLKTKIHLLIGFILSTISILISSILFYNIGSLFVPIIIYLIFGGLSYSLSRKFKKINT